MPTAVRLQVLELLVFRAFARKGVRRGGVQGSENVVSGVGVQVFGDPKTVLHTRVHTHMFAFKKAHTCVCTETHN